MTPPRIRGLVDGLERAIRMEYRSPKDQRAARKKETLAAKLRLLNAFAVVAGGNP